MATYRIEVESITKRYVDVEALDEQEARELAISGVGETGDSIPIGEEITDIQILEGKCE